MAVRIGELLLKEKLITPDQLQQALNGAVLAKRAVKYGKNHVNIDSAIARSPGDYVRIASELARDKAWLSELRSTLRNRMRASPLMQAKRFTQNLESAFRSMWRQWCDQPLGR